MKIDAIGTVSEWIEAGRYESGFYLIERPPVEERPKAVGFRWPKCLGSGDIVDAVVWFPKSQVKTIVNDYYSDTLGQDVTLVPCWLIWKKDAEGFIFH